MINIVILKTTIMITDDNNENIIKKKKMVTIVLIYVLIYKNSYGFSVFSKKVCLSSSVAISNTQYQTYKLLPSCEYW